MSQKKIPIADASIDDLKKFATETLGLSFAPNIGRDTLLSKIKLAWTQDDIVVNADDVPSQQDRGATQPPTKAGSTDAGKVVIHIGISETDGGTDDVPVGVNGRVMTIPRGKNVPISYPYYEALKAAVMHKFDPRPDGGMNPVPRKVTRYPFNTLSSEAEIEAARLYWVERDQKAQRRAA